MRRPLLCFLLALPLTAQQPLARDIFRQLIEINTTDSLGDNTRAAEAMAARFRAAGYPDTDIRVLGPVARKGNLVVRLHGTNATARPILFIGHLDVVEAELTDWSFDPFVFREQDGYYYGRGTQDMKGDDALLVTTFLRMKQEGFVPARDLILALTSDEEGGDSNGIDWLVKNHRDLIDAEFAMNADAGGGVIKNGRHLYMAMQAAEKIYLSFKLEVTNPGGHSSRPSHDNAIYHLADGLSRLGRYDFPVRLFDVTRSYFETVAPFYPGQLGADMKAVGGIPDSAPNNIPVITRLSAQPPYNAQLRTTCIPTLLAGGHAENAQPQSATAVVNCRLLPIDNADNVESTLIQVLGDPQIKLSRVKPAKPVRQSPINQKVLSAVTAAVTKNWPGLPVIPKMSTGASDGIYLISAGIPTYGVSGIFTDEDDDRSHGKDERILVKSFDEALPFVYDLITALAR